MGDRRREPDGVQHRSATDNDDVALPIQIRVVNRLQNPFKMSRVVLDRLSPRDDLDNARRFEPVRATPKKGFQVGDQIRTSGGDKLIHPNLNPGLLVAGGFQEIDKHATILAHEIVGVTKPMGKGYRERSVSPTGSGILIDHADVTRGTSKSMKPNPKRFSINGTIGNQEIIPD